MCEIGGGDGETRMLILTFGLRHSTWRIWLSKLSLVSFLVRLASRKQVDYEAAAVSVSACPCHLEIAPHDSTSPPYGLRIAYSVTGGGQGSSPLSDEGGWIEKVFVTSCGDVECKL